MNPEIYDDEEIVLIKSLIKRFRVVISEDESLYGFTVNDIDEVSAHFPDVDLYDEEANGYDPSGDVLGNMFTFILNDNPEKILKENEYIAVSKLCSKLKYA